MTAAFSAMTKIVPRTDALALLHNADGMHLSTDVDALQRKPPLDLKFAIVTCLQISMNVMSTTALARTHCANGILQ
jgi:hypothetical protein